MNIKRIIGMAAVPFVAGAMLVAGPGVANAAAPKAVPYGAACAPGYANPPGKIGTGYRFIKDWGNRCQYESSTTRASGAFNLGRTTTKATVYVYKIPMKCPSPLQVRC